MYARGLARDVDEQVILSVYMCTLEGLPEMSMNSSFCQCCLTPYVYARGLAQDVDEQFLLSVLSYTVFVRDVDLLYCSYYYEYHLKNAQKLVVKKISTKIKRK